MQSFLSTLKMIRLTITSKGHCLQFPCSGPKPTPFPRLARCSFLKEPTLALFFLKPRLRFSSLLWVKTKQNKTPNLPS